MKVVVEPDEEKLGKYVAKMYYIDEVKNVAKLIAEQVGLHTI